jgi:hypothetical protein
MYSTGTCPYCEAVWVKGRLRPDNQAPRVRRWFPRDRLWASLRWAEDTQVKPLAEEQAAEVSRSVKGDAVLEEGEEAWTA